MSIYDYDSTRIAEVKLDSLPQSVQGALEAVGKLPDIAIIVRVDPDENAVYFDAVPDTFNIDDDA